MNNTISKIFNSYVIAETSLGVECCKILLAAGHKVSGIITSNENSIEWSIKNNIPYFLSIKELEDINPSKTFDYLFSIVNGKVLSSRILDYPRLCAINYHDAPLPKYAGIHATSWAIINDEKTHGISWHVMSSRIDEGDILEQNIFPIEVSDTALMLNLKCYNHALESFRLLVKKLEKQSVHSFPQELRNRSYYGYHQKPENVGLADWKLPAQDIDRLFRGLYFGNYPNKLASFKVLIDQEIFFPHSLIILNKKTGNKLGVLLKIDTSGLQISTQTEDILIDNITNIEGELCSSSYLKNIFNLYEGYQFPSLNPITKKDLYQSLITISYSERYWVNNLLQVTPFKLPLSSSLKKVANIAIKKRFVCNRVEIDKDLKKQINKKFDKIPLVDILVGTFYIYLSRLGSKNTFTLDYSDHSVRNFTNGLNSFLSSEISLTVDISGKVTGYEAIQKSLDIKSKSLKNHTYSLDIKERYPFLKEKYTDKPDVKINVIELEERFKKNEISHLLEICIDQKGTEYSLIFPKNLSEAEKYLMNSIPNHIKYLLEAFVKDPVKLVGNLPVFNLEEQEQILLEWNDTYRQYPSDITLQKLFDQNIEEFSSNIAVTCENTVLTYQELNERANQLAHLIKQKKNIEPDSLIAICLDRSEYTLIAMLAILKSGGAYVPLDPNYPDDRICHIFDDTNTTLVLANAKYTNRLKKIHSRLKSKSHEELLILELDSEELHNELILLPSTSPLTSTTSEDLAYVIYTSGTTGKPKGVMVEHRNIVNLILSVQEILDVNAKDIFFFYRSYVFDGVIEETMLPIMIGAKLAICTTGLNDLPKFLDTIRNNNISIANINSETAQVLGEYIDETLSLKKIIAGGTKLNLNSFSNFLKKGVTVFNSYGPTECTVDSTYFKVDSLKNEWIGKPISNYNCYVLNEDLKLLPIGAIGELYIGGDGVARGYLNQDNLTKEKFISNPFQTDKENNDKSCSSKGRNSRLYKTGDLVRWLPDGNLEYIGRKDNQVKIRGYRIELGEIESILSNYKDIKQSVIIVKERGAGEKYLVGYYVSNKVLNEGEIFSYLQSKLPEYMIPSAIIHLEHLPLTINGKLDKEALPEARFTNTKTYVAPRNEVEEKVTKIWEEVLGLPKNSIGIEDNFFRLGGDSIISIQIVSRLRERLDLLVNLKDIFNYKTIKGLYENVLSKKQEKLETRTEQGILIGEVPFLPIQEWFFKSDFKYPNYWNQSFLIKTPNLNVERLISSISTLVSHHDVFRLRYKKSKIGRVYNQFYDSKASLPDIKILDINTLSNGLQKAQLQDMLSDWQSKFDLEEGPLHCIGYLYGYEDGSARIFFALHHLIVDTVSWRILLEDLRKIYNGEFIDIKGSSYRQWTQGIIEYVSKNEEERNYWNNTFLDFKKRNKFKELQASQDSIIINNIINVSISREHTRRLLQETNQAYNTQINDILLTALGYTLKELTNSTVHHIVLEGHGREEVIGNGLDISRTVGWFTTIYPVRLEIKDDIGKSIKNIKEMLRQIPNNGIGYGAIFGYKNKDLPKISFNYLGQFNHGGEKKQLENNWSISAEEAGVSVHQLNSVYDVINITGLIINECLNFRIISKLNYEETEILKDQFKQNLEKIIIYLSSQTRTYLTTSDVNNIISQEYLDKIQEKKEIIGVYKANSLQQGFIYHTLRQGALDNAYRAQLVWQYENKINPSCLKKAWEMAQRKYSSLRIRFEWSEEIVQIIDKEGTLDWIYLDLSAEQSIEIKIQEILKDDNKKPYDLKQGSLFRLILIKQREDLYTCIFNSHHSILDGWSNPILLGYVHRTYLKLCFNNTIPLEINSSYDLVQQYLQMTKKKNEEYWEKYVSRIDDRGDLSLLLKTGLQNTSIRNYNHIKEEKEKVFEIEGEQYRNLKELSKNEGITLNAILQYSWHKTQSLYEDSMQTVVGTTVSGRNQPINGIENAVGLFINTLPLIVDHQRQPNSSIITCIKQIQDDINEISIRSNIDLAQIQKGGNRLFDCLFVYENYPTLVNNEDSGQLAIRFIKSVEKIDYPIAVVVYEKKTKLIFKLKYASELFDIKTIDRVLTTFKVLLNEISINPYQEERYLSGITKADYKQVVEIWNNTNKKYKKDKTIGELFDEQVIRTPNNIAVIDSSNNKEYKYSSLKNESDLLSKYLLKYQADNKIETNNSSRKPIELKGILIGVLSEKSYNQIISVLSIIKSGHGYLPLNLEMPIDRIDEILTNSGVQILLISKHFYSKNGMKNKLLNKYKLLVIENVLLEIREDNKLKKALSSIRLPLVKEDDIAYVIFTSGSTGKPKGVTINHKGAINTINAINQRFNVTSKDKIFAISELSFDLSVYDIFGIMFVGGSLALPRQDKVRNPSFWLSFIEKHKITIWNSVPQLLDLLINETEISDSYLKSLRLFLLSGDWIPLTLPDRLKNRANNAIVMSLGGATEASIWSVWYEINRIHNDWISIPYGTPMPNQKLYVLNYYNEICSVDMIGEIHIGGAGVALNYWNDPERTQKSFINHNKLGRLYKTGDIGKWTEDGYIRMLGRKDNQVKISGYRIELGEIENVLISHSEVKQCVSLVKEHETGGYKSKYLVAYYTSNSGEKIEENILFSFLSDKLPDFMTPTVIVYLDKFPLTANGKLDRSALPDPEFGTTNYYPPTNELESKICNIFTEILGMDISNISIRDNFFSLGGNSILAIKLVSKINRELGIQLSVESIYTNKNIEKIVQNIEYSDHQNIVIRKSNALKVNSQLLSFTQERLWFIEKYEQGTNAYNIPILVKISDNISLSTLKKSIDSIIQRHQILRTFIKEDSEGNNYQVISALNAKYIKEVKVNNVNILNDLLTQDANYIFDLNNEYPIRVRIYSLSSSDYYLSVVIHHIACDGWSINIFLKELERYYQYYINQNLLDASEIDLPELTIQYKDFALWQRNYLTGKILDKQLLYWKNKLAGYETINLVTDYIRPPEIDYKGNKVYFELDLSLSNRLRRVAKKLDVSLYSLLLSAYLLMIRSYTNQNDIVIGTPVANRHYPQIEHLIGFFVNTLAIRVNIDSSSKLVDFIKYVGDEIIESQIHQDLPFGKLVEELDIIKDRSKHPIFQIMFGLNGFENLHDNTDSIFSYIRDSNKYYNISKFDLETFVDESTDVLKGSFNYRISLYKEETIKRYISNYIELLKQVGDLLEEKYDKSGSEKATERIRLDEIKLKEKKIEDISYLSDQDYNLIISTWNNTDLSFPDKKTIDQLFEEQVKRTPDNIALVYKDIELTYRELNQKANRLAHYLVEECEIKPDSLVLLLLERSEEIIVSILAVLKAGGAYVPMDPEYPDKRIAYIMMDTKAKVILTNQIYEDRIKILNIQSKKLSIISVDSNKFKRAINSYKSTNTNIPNLTSSNLAYVIYTSGTTGNPKGVMIEHRSTVNLAIMQGKEFGLSMVDKFTNHKDIKNCLCYANYVFDASVSEILTCILSGNKLYLLSNDERLNLDSLDKYIKNNNINIATIPPALLNQESYNLNLSTLVVAGEQMSNKIYYYYVNNNNKLINAYGPTEVTVCSSLRCYKENDIVSNIGTPLSNTKVYVLSTSLNPLPIGAIGELYVGGVGLARGYLNNPSLTNEKFISNPFQTDEEKKDKSYGSKGRNSRLYKTGDLVRWLLDGNLEYIGRNDFQLKIRGYRVELSEIESVFSLFSGVKQCVVIAKEHITNAESKYLVGYYTGEKLDQNSSLSFLKHKLPEYMVPNAIVHLDKFPLTINGKLDRKALPEIELRNSRDTYVAPRNELEGKICSVFAEVLGIDPSTIGIRDDFFRMGGDSIISMQLVSKLRQKLLLSSISVKDIFSSRTIENLYDNVIKSLQGGNVKDETVKEQGILSGIVSLLPIQKWFFENRFTVSHHWNQSFVIKTPELDLEVLSKSIKVLVEHHDALRLRYTKKQTQYYDDKVIIEKINVLDVNTITDKELSSVFTSWQSNFNIQRGPLYSIGYIRGFKDGSARIFFAFHHLIIDTVSWRILTEDLRELYYKIVRGDGSLSLGEKGSSYRQWVSKVDDYKTPCKDEKNYWDNVVLDIEKSNKILKSLATSLNTFSEFVLGTDLTNKLLLESLRAYNSEINDVLLTALSLSLNESIGTRVNHITMEGHGREEVIGNGLDISRTVGWFTTMYPVRLEVRSDGADEISSAVKHTKELLKQVPNKGIGYGTLVGYSVNSLPKISFNYLGQLTQEKHKNSRNHWGITDEPSGVSVSSENDSKNIIDINGVIIERKLKFSVVTKLDKYLHTKFVNSFKKNLRKVINHSIGKLFTEYTMSDYVDFQPYAIVNMDKVVDKNVLFMIPPGEGGAESYFNNLVPLLDNRKLVIFNNFMRHLTEHDIEQSESMTYEKLAHNYISYIKSIQSQGPYNLLGWSFGGVMAFEIAKQLIEHGDQVSSLIIIDSYFSFSSAATKINIRSSEQENINYKYLPVIKNKNLAFWKNANITLFKATKDELFGDNSKYNSWKNFNKINNHYVTYTKHNYLDTILEENVFTTVEIPHSHSSWIYDKNQINQICSILL